MAVGDVIGPVSGRWYFDMGEGVKSRAFPSADKARDAGAVFASAIKTGGEVAAKAIAEEEAAKSNEDGGGGGVAAAYWHMTQGRGR